MKTFQIPSPCDSTQIECLLAEPKGEPKGIVQLVHGMCEHKERYIPFMEFLSDNGYVVIINDHRGHGQAVKSEELGYFGLEGWSRMIDDAEAVGRWARSRFPGLKFTLFGHSMGSLVVRGMMKRNDTKVDTLFVCGCPSDNPARTAGMVLVWLIGMFKGSHHRSKFLQKLMFGAFNKPFSAEGYPSAWVCSDENVLEAYHKDPLCQFIFTADGFMNLLKLMDYCYAPQNWNVTRPDTPVHFISGAEDPCRVSDKALQAAVNTMKSVGYTRTDLKLYPGMRHEILNETDKQTVWNDVLHSLA